MKLLEKMFKGQAAAALVKQGLCDGCQMTRSAIMNSLQLLAGALGDSWQRVSREAAAGMVLVMLAKNKSLASYLNSTGWQLVMAFVSDHPELARNLSPRALADIGIYRSAGIGGFAAQPA
jgi:hypothetical protein